MKKCLSLLLALVLTLSFLTFTVSADETEITPYALACSSCRNAMDTVSHRIRGGSFKVQSCSGYNWEHMHFEVYIQTYWVCNTVGCAACSVEIPAGNPVYAGTECGISG